MRALFLCIYNSARSQLAEGLARELGQGKVEAFSAGLQATGVNPYAARVMAEIGIDISGQRSKSVEEFLNEKFDFVITLCSGAEAVCPVFPGQATRLHWPLADPARTKGTEEEMLNAFRRVRDDLKAKIESLLGSL